VGLTAGLDTEVRGKILGPTGDRTPDRPVVKSVTNVMFMKYTNVYENVSQFQASLPQSHSFSFRLNLQHYSKISTYLLHLIISKSTHAMLFRKKYKIKISRKLVKS
jgi:hypothetical protein